MNIAVRYHSQTGNTKKLADEIAKIINIKAEDCYSEINEPTDLLFLGGSVYGFGLDEHTKNYIKNLDSNLVKKVAVFGTSAIVKNGNNQMIKLLEEKNIPVVKENFYCKGRFKFIHKGRPNDDDINDVINFANKIIESI